ncbi:hypothetical protein scyTo_0019162 [Scyliorhinus torazame]|uniref:WAPL domain-containing protein n=1 Tax=Scyliorhinus torazame TaxID=75743 RepID=A0A401PTX8_SCYTO|nr:hypothetical protein [Scyliorhinus torazame]
MLFRRNRRDLLKVPPHQPVFPTLDLQNTIMRHPGTPAAGAQLDVKTSGGVTTAASPGRREYERGVNMTSRYGKTYSKKGSASNSKFDELFSGKRAKISTKWGESTFKAQLSQKRPCLKVEAVEQPKRQKLEDELLEDPFGFDSDDDSLPVSSRNPVPTKGQQSTESLKPVDEDNVASLLEVNSTVNQPISGDAIVCSKFAALADRDRSC